MILIRQAAPLPSSVRMENRDCSLEPISRGWGRGVLSGIFWLWWGVVTSCLSATLPSLPLLPGSLRPVQVTVFGFIFCRARLSPGRGGGREQRRGEGIALSAQSRAPPLLPSLARLPPSSRETSPWAQWGPRPPWDLLCWGTSRPFSPYPFSFRPAAKHQSQKGPGDRAEPRLLFTHGETEARRKDPSAQGHSTHGPPQ